MSGFTAEHAKKLVDRFWNGERVESLAEEEDVTVDKIIALLLNENNEVAITIPLTNAEFAAAVVNSRGYLEFKKPILMAIKKILGPVDDTFVDNGVLIYTFSRGGAKLHSTRNGVDINFMFRSYDNPTAKETNAIPDMKIKLINLFTEKAREAARQAKDLIHGEQSGLLRDAEKTKGLAEEGSALDRALAAGILPKTVGQFLTSEDIKGYSVKPTISTIKKKHYGVGRRHRSRRRRSTRRR